jgi:hypothetical protein
VPVPRRDYIQGQDLEDRECSSHVLMVGIGQIGCSGEEICIRTLSIAVDLVPESLVVSSCKHRHKRFHQI